MNKREQLKQRAINCLKSNNPELEELKKISNEVEKEKDDTEITLNNVKEIDDGFDTLKQSQIQKKEIAKQRWQKAKDFLKVATIVAIMAGTIYGVHNLNKEKNNTQEIVNEVIAEEFAENTVEENIISDNAGAEINNDVKAVKNTKVKKAKVNPSDIPEEEKINSSNENNKKQTSAKVEGKTTIEFSSEGAPTQDDIGGVTAEAAPKEENKTQDNKKEDKGKPNIDTTQKSTEVTDTKGNATSPKVQEENNAESKEKAQPSIDVNAATKQETAPETNAPSELESDELKDLLKKAEDQELEL